MNTRQYLAFPISAGIDNGKNFSFFHIILSTLCIAASIYLFFSFVLSPKQAGAQFLPPGFNCQPSPVITSPDEELRNYGSGNECSAGPVQEVPEGFALTGIGYGADDYGCFIWIKTARLNADNSVDFSSVDSNWRGHVTCPSDSTRSSQGNSVVLNDGWNPGSYTGDGGGNGSLASSVLPDKVMTGWTWGAPTSGGGPGSHNSNFPDDECYYQEYMKLDTRQVFGFGSQYDGTCSERGYTQQSLQLIVKAPAGRVIVAIQFDLDKDTTLKSMSAAYRIVRPSPIPTPTPQAANFEISVTPPGGRDVIRGATASTAYVVTVFNCSGGVTSVSLDPVATTVPTQDTSFSYDTTSLSCNPGSNTAILTVSPGSNSGPLSLPSGPYADIGMTITGRSGGVNKSVNTALWIYERPSVSVRANNQLGTISIVAGSPLVISWSPLNTQNGLFCTASNAWNGPKSSSHAQNFTENITGLPPGNYTFTISCLGANNVASPAASVNVSVTGVVPTITPTPTPTPTSTPTPTPIPPSAFSLSCPNGITVNDNNARTISIPVSVLPASGGPLTFSAGFTSGPSPLPSVRPPNGTISSPSYATTILVDINNTVNAGTYNLTVAVTRGTRVTCTVPITVSIAADQLVSISMSPLGQQFVNGEGYDYTVIGTYRRANSSQYTTNVTSLATFTPSTGALSFSGRRATSQFVGNGTITARVGTVSTVTGFSVSDFGISCPATQNITLTGPTVPPNTIVNLSFALTTQNGFNRNATLVVNGPAGVLAVPNPRVRQMSSGNYNYTIPVDMSGKPQGVYSFSASMGYLNPGASPPYSRSSSNSPCNLSINVGAVTNYDLNIDSIIGFVMQDDDTNPANNLVSGPMIHQYRLRLDSCTGGVVANGIELKPITLNAVSGVDWGYYEETSPGNFVNRGQNIGMRCGQIRYLRINARNTLAPLNPNNSPLSNQSFNFRTGTSGIGDKQHNLVIGLYGRPKVISFVASPPSVTSGQSSTLIWRTENVPTGGFYCNGTGGVNAWAGPKYNSPPAASPGGSHTVSNLPAGNQTFSLACGVIFRNALFYSTPASVTVNVAAATSNQPVNVVGDNATCGKMFIRWEKPSTGLAPTAYKVYRFVGSSWVLITTVNVTNAAQQDYVFEDPSPVAQNYYSVSSMQGPTESLKTVASNNPIALVTCTSSEPRNVIGNNSVCGKITIRWQKPSSGLAPTAYRVYKFNLNTSAWQPIANIAVANASVVDYSFDDPSPLPLLNYYSVTSFQGINESIKAAASNNPIPLISCTPNRPNITTTSSTCTNVVVNWTHSGSIPLRQFRIYRNGPRLTEVPAGQLSFIDPSPQASNTYEISAISTTGIESPKSAAVTQAWNGCDPRLDASNKRILDIAGVNNPFATQNPCDPTFNRLDIKARVDQVVTFLVNICNTGTGALVAGNPVNRQVIIDDTQLTHLKKSGNSWNVKIQGNDCRQAPQWSPASGTAPQCQYTDSGAGLRINLRNGTLVTGGNWQITFKAIITTAANENGNTFSMRNIGVITYPKTTPPNGTKVVDTLFIPFIRGSGDGVELKEIAPGGN